MVEPHQDNTKSVILTLTIINALYAISLKSFLISVNEDDNFIQTLCELGLSLLLVACAWLYTSLGLCAFACALSSSVSLYLYRRYVSGKKYQTVSLEGKVYIITGSNTGIGFETAKQLVEMGATVILACRTPDKAREARDLILSQTKCPVTRVIVIKLDLCGFDSVRKFVKEFRALGLPLNGLINNAGVMMQERSLTQDGFETVFTANHLSHFLLTNLLLPELEKSNGRIVNLTSALHKNAKRFIFEDVMSEKNYSLFGTYSQSKLANILFTFELQRRLSKKGSKVTVNAVHPGCVMTDVTRNMPLFMRIGDTLATPIMMVLRKTAPQGAYTSVYVATSPELDGVGGKYFQNCREGTVGAAAQDEKSAEVLWMISERLTGLSQEGPSR